MAVKAGELIKPIVLKVPTNTRNAQGEKESTFAPLPEIRARVKQTSQRRALEVARHMLKTDTVGFRYSNLTKDINEEWLVEYDGLNHSIESIEVNKQERSIELVVKVKKDG